MHKVEGRIASVDTPLTPCDGPVHENGQPTISFGVRGVLDIELRARSANRDLHSGHWGGYRAQSPLDTRSSARHDEKRAWRDHYRWLLRERLAADQAGTPGSSEPAY